MRTIDRATAFKRDYKRAKATPHHKKDLDSLLGEVLNLLLTDQALPPHNRDHALVGEWAGYRDCHIKPDLVMIYGKPDADTLRLVRLGSHSALFR
jgi:mRNA interferase YafQ